MGSLRYTPATNGTPFFFSNRITVMMFYVYLLRSESDRTRTYVGFSEDLKQRILDHNAGKCVHTAKYRPWQIETYVAFSCREQALDFERYREGCARCVTPGYEWHDRNKLAVSA